ncbi:MAG: HupE/UreJ family protein [Candidatus Competibacteraceae bacterium]
MRSERLLIILRVGLALALTLGAGTVHAHVAVTQAGAFYAGLLHPLTAPEHVLPWIALGLLAGQQGLNKGQGILLIFPIALALGAGLALGQPTPDWIFLLNLGSLVLLGGLVAAAWRLPAALLYALALLFGVTHGYANGTALTSNLSPPVFVVGLVAAALLIVGYGLGCTAYLLRLKPAWLSIAVRVAGSWITAVGILVLSMSGKTVGAS